MKYREDGPMSNIKLFTVKLFSKEYPSFPEGGLRHLIFHAGSNGLQKSGALVRVGRKVLIDEERFFSWLKPSGDK